MENPDKVTVENVMLKIVSVRGTCAVGHKEGQEFDMSQDNLIRGILGNKDVPAICPYLFNVAFHLITTLQLGGEIRFEEDREKAHVRCPDPFNEVIAEIRRVKRS